MKTGNTEHIDITALTAWFRQAAPGAVFIYAVGDLASDRGTRYRGAPTTMLDAVGLLAWEWSYRRMVHLMQRRIGPRGFAYMVVRRDSFAVATHERIARERAALAARLGMVDAIG